MSWRTKLIIVFFFTVFCAATWTVRPYWNSWVKSEKTMKGWVAREERKNDSIGNALQRAATGSGLGLVISLLGLTLRDYGKGSGRRLHWTGLDVRGKENGGRDVL